MKSFLLVALMLCGGCTGPRGVTRATAHSSAPQPPPPPAQRAQATAGVVSAPARLVPAPLLPPGANNYLWTLEFSATSPVAGFAPVAYNLSPCPFVAGPTLELTNSVPLGFFRYVRQRGWHQ